jgi:hypothetical protein
MVTLIPPTPREVTRVNSFIEKIMDDETGSDEF